MTRRKWILDLRQRLRAVLGLGPLRWRGAAAGGWFGSCAGLVGLGDSGDLPQAEASSLRGSGFFSPLWG
jgi:hypothetical protein